MLQEFFFIALLGMLYLIQLDENYQCDKIWHTYFTQLFSTALQSTSTHP